MSDQISEKMARKLAHQIAEYTCYGQECKSSTEARCMRAWRAASLIKPSKLDEAREWVRRMDVCHKGDSSYVDGARDAAERFEAAITEIMEERE